MRQERFQSRLASTKRQSDTTTMCLPDELLYLVVDAGGSACRVAIADSKGRVISRGASGASNPSDYGFDGAFSAVQDATTKALSSLGRHLFPFPFSKTWLAMAGCDSVQAGKEAASSAKQLFQADADIFVTNDCALLSAAIAAPPNQNCTRGITLISGTGSIAAYYDFESADRFEPQDRSGGLGHLLGDEGSGFHIGQQLLKIIMTEDVEAHMKLVTEVFKHYHVSCKEELLPEVYSNGPSSQPVDRKLRIAGLARLCQAFAFPQESRWPADFPKALDCAPDELALRVLKSAAAELSDLVKTLYRRHDVKDGVLACGQGVLSSPGFQILLRAELATWQPDFRSIVFPEDVLALAAQLLSAMQ